MSQSKDKMFQSIEKGDLHDALSAFGRSINIVSTYGIEHPAFQQSIKATHLAFQTLFLEKKSVILGAFNGVMTVDEIPVTASGVLLKSLERHLVRLRITGLRIVQGISAAELMKLIELLAQKAVDDFSDRLSQSGLKHIETETTRFEAVRKGQTVANESDLAGGDGSGVLVLEEDFHNQDAQNDASEETSVHVDQIVAFLQGDLNTDDAEVSEELEELASDPARLGQMIMESVAIRQTAAPLAGESLGDIILGCLRRTYSGLRNRPAFQTTEGKADLQKALLLLEEGILDKMRDIAGDADPELDRQIVQTIREMDENLGFEMAANEYLEHRDAVEDSKRKMQEYVHNRGENDAAELISNSDFPSTDWRRIVVESRQQEKKRSLPPLADGLSALTRVFEKLEHVMKSETAGQDELHKLLDQANDNLDDATFSTKEKLHSLSKHLEDTGTIGGHGLAMSRAELLSSMSEIAQELMQPLTAISVSQQMLLEDYAGQLNEEQHKMLELANNSSAHLTYLINELINIVGCPTNKGVDDRFHTTSEQVILMQQQQKAS